LSQNSWISGGRDGQKKRPVSIRPIMNCLIKFAICILKSRTRLARVGGGIRVRVGSA